MVVNLTPHRIVLLYISTLRLELMVLSQNNTKQCFIEVRFIVLTRQICPNQDVPCVWQFRRKTTSQLYSSQKMLAICRNSGLDRNFECAARSWIHTFGTLKCLFCIYVGSFHRISRIHYLHRFFRNQWHSERSGCGQIIQHPGNKEQCIRIVSLEAICEAFVRVRCEFFRLWTFEYERDSVHRI